MIQTLLSPFARRFVAGETAEAAIAAARSVNARGIGAILDFLGEDVLTSDGASKAVDEYIRLLKHIKRAGVRAAVSLKASQMGVLIDPELCVRNLRQVVEAASREKLFVWMDMEGSSLTQKTIDAFQALRNDFQNVGLCVQAYLRRTEADADALARRPVTLRLCKGAYKEPASLAYPTRVEVEENFRRLAQKLLQAAERGGHPAFATHDPALIDFIRKETQAGSLDPTQFEFQMLYGIRSRLLENLARQGYAAWAYIPYGTAWLPYFLRRLRERKENVYFLIRNAFRM